MNIRSRLFRIYAVVISVVYSTCAYSYESSLVSGIDVRNEYHDNIFLTDLPHDSVTAIVVTPAVSGVIKDKNWSATLDARLRSNHYSDSNLDSDDKYFDLTGRYAAERDIFSLHANYDLDSNLSSTSSDFGITGRRINREKQSIIPQYTRLLTERSALIIAYTYTDVDYLEAEGTGYVPYTSDAVNGTVAYNLSERDKLTLSLQAVDYKSKNELTEYQLFVSRIGVEHNINETLSADILAGVSRQSTSNANEQTFDFFGTTITRRVESDFNNRGFVLNAGFKQLFEDAKLEGRISRDNVTNSFGGLNEVDRIQIDYDDEITSLWRYIIRARYEDINAVSVVTQSTDREVFFFESVLYYTITRNLEANASYRYIARKFSSDTSDDRAPDSNRIYIGLTYNFPTLSTF